MAYVYKPYPKWITLEDGSQRIVRDEAEHRQFLPVAPPEDLTPPAVAVPIEPPVAIICVGAGAGGTKPKRKYTRRAK